MEPAPELDWDLLRRMARTACRRVPSWVPRDDIVQEANLAAWRAAGRWKEAGGTTFGSFVTERALGAVHDVMRASATSTRAGHPRPVVVPLDETVDLPSRDRDAVLDNDLRETLDRALARLPAKHRHVIVEHFLHQRTNVEVARDLGLSESAVSLICKGALARLGQDSDLRDWVGLAA